MKLDIIKVPVKLEMWAPQSGSSLAQQACGPPIKIERRAGTSRANLCNILSDTCRNRLRGAQVWVKIQRDILWQNKLAKVKTESRSQIYWE